MWVKKIKPSRSVRRLWGRFAGDKGTLRGPWTPFPHSTVLCHMCSECVAGEVQPLSSAHLWLPLQYVIILTNPTLKKQTRV